VSPLRIRRHHLVIAGVLIGALVAAAFWLHSLWIWRGFADYRMEQPQDIPTAIAVGKDGAVWFTIDFADAIGVFKDNRIQRIPKGRENFEPLGLAVDRDGAAWYTDGPSRLISRMSPDGAVASFALSTPVAKLARLAAAPDGAVWFAEESSYSFTRLKDGTFTRHAVSTPGIAPFGVAVDASGTVWGTLPRANRLVRISARGEIAELDLPARGGAGLVDRHHGLRDRHIRRVDDPHLERVAVAARRERERPRRERPRRERPHRSHGAAPRPTSKARGVPTPRRFASLIELTVSPIVRSPV